jgi:hypothetical protein
MNKAFKTNLHTKTALALAISLSLMAPTQAADFTIKSGQIVTTPQTLATDNDVGVIEAGGELDTSATAITASAKNNSVTNKGSLSTKGNNAIGIYSIGTDATISNEGTISTEGLFGYGISSSGTDATISNEGTISTVEKGASGISSFGAGATISNLGTITTVGDNAHGIFSFGAGATISNLGTITTVGDNAHGIFSERDDATINNSGSISASEFGSAAIRSTGDNATINNSGSISASGFGSAAIRSIRMGPTNTTLNLLPGSQIMGRIDLGSVGDNDTANVYGGSVSANLTFENTENINIFGAGVRSGNSVITVDTTGESTRGVALAGMTSSVHGIISQRMNQTPQYQPIQVAALEVSPGMLYTERKPIAWAQFFGGTFNRDAEGDALGYDYDHAGVNVGYEWDVTETRFGLMGGFVKSDTDTEASSFSSGASNFYVGAYGNRKFGGVSMTGSLIAGYSDVDNKRRVIDNLNGVETATSDFDSFFVSPSVTLASAYTLTDHWEFRPSTNLSYSMAWLDGYSETGTSNSNLTVDDRTAKALHVRAQLAAAYLISARSELELRLGLNSRNTDDDDTKVSIGGSQFKFANAGDKNVTGGFAGASLRIFNQNNLTLVADLEVGGNSDEDYVAGNLNLEYLF